MWRRQAPSGDRFRPVADIRSVRPNPYVNRHPRPASIDSSAIDAITRTIFLTRLLRIVTTGIALSVLGCAAAPIKMEPRSFAKRLGLPNCRASVPLSQSEAIEIGRKWELYPNPADDPEWIKMAAIQRPGDQLRLVSCTVGDPYFYALIRNDTIVFKFHLSVLD